MSIETLINRYQYVIERLKKSPATWKEISDYLERKSRDEDKDFVISIRTFQRDKKKLLPLFKCEIECEKKGEKRYFIKSILEPPEHTQQLLDSYQIIDAIKSTAEDRAHIFFEARKATGFEHFPILLKAIKLKKTIEFTHNKYQEDISKDRMAHPLALKQAKGRWYLIAVDIKDDKLKTFGLDRISDISLCKSAFKNNYTHDIKALFKNSFGIINDENQKPQKIVLSFTYEQGRYVKNYPLHHSQKIVKEDEDNVLIELYLTVTYDFIMELLSFGQEVKIISPATLINKVQKMYKNALNQYQVKH